MLTEGATEREAAIVAEHFDYLTALAQEGKLLLAGRTQNRDSTSFGIAIFCADSDEDAQRMMANDPAVKNGVMRAELFPYRVGILAPAEHWDEWLSSTE